MKATAFKANVLAGVCCTLTQLGEVLACLGNNTTVQSHDNSTGIFTIDHDVKKYLARHLSLRRDHAIPRNNHIGTSILGGDAVLHKRNETKCNSTRRHESEELHMIGLFRV